MKKLEFKTSLIAYEHIDLLPDSRQRALCLRARTAQLHAYAPYSRFRVGAAVLLQDGLIVEGSNQENAVYPLGLCAERVAINSANTLYHNCRMEAIALVTDAVIQHGSMPVFPCGSCRQVIAEQEYRQGHKIQILVLGAGDHVFISEGVEHILPFIMNTDTLRSNRSLQIS